MEKMDLFCEDCHATMRRMVSDGQKVDLILTSPPYNSSKKKIKEDLSGYHRRYDVYEDDKDNDEYVGWMFDTMALFDSVLFFGKSSIHMGLHRRAKAEHAIYGGRLDSLEKGERPA